MAPGKGIRFLKPLTLLAFTAMLQLQSIAPTWASMGDLSVYQLWEFTFYGGLLMAARIFTVWAERTRRLLHLSATARSCAEALLDAARLEALQSQIDPDLLLDSPTTAFKFPSLLMLPLIALGGDGGRPMLHVKVQSGQTVLSLDGLSRSVSAELYQQIRTRLHALYGEHFNVECYLPALHQLRITLSAAPAPPIGSHEPAS